jgi:hypothetical protein
MFDEIFFSLSTKLKTSEFLLYHIIVGLFQKAIMESGTLLLELDGSYGYAHTSEIRAKQLCNFTDAQWTAANFAPLKQCLQNMTVQQFIDLDIVSGKNILGQVQHRESILGLY